VCSISFDCIDQIFNQIKSQFHLHIDISKCIVNIVFQFDQSIVRKDEKDEDKPNDNQNNINKFHEHKKIYKKDTLIRYYTISNPTQTQEYGF